MRHSTSLLLGLSTLSVMAQTEGSNFTVSGTGIATTLVSDYQSIGINPANLGFDLKYEDPRFAFGLLEMSYSVYTNGVTRKVLRKDMLRDFDRTFTGNEQEMAAQNFTDADLAVNADVRLFGFAFQHDKAGGFAVQVADRFQWSSFFNATTAELLFQGRKADYFSNLQLSDGGIIANSSGLSEDTLAMVVRGFNNVGEGRNISQLMDDTRIALNWTREDR